MEGRHRQGRDRLRACRLGDRQFRAPDRAHGRAQCAGDPGAAPVYRHRAASGDPWRASAKGLPEMGVLRESDSSWYMREEAGGLLLGPYEDGAPACYVDGPSAESEYELFQEDLDRLGAAYRDRDRARAGVRRGRRQEGLQRRHRLYAGRLADRRPGAGPAQFLAQRGPFASASPPPAAPAGSWPNGSSRASRRSTCSASIRAASAPMRRPGYPDREERRGLRQGLHRALSRRRARRRAAAAPDALLRPHEGARRGVWLGLRLGAAELVRAARLRAERRAISPSPTCCSTRTIPPGRRARARNGASAAPTISSSSAPNAATCMRTSACRTCRPSPNSRCPGPAPRAWLDSILTNKLPEGDQPRHADLSADQARRRARRIHADADRSASVSISSPPARWRRTTSIRCRSCCRPTAACGSTR